MRTVWLALPVIIVIGWLDYVTGPEIGLSLLYLLPISLTAWRGRGGEAIAAAVLAAACWIGADLVARDAIVLTIWNGFTRVVIYVATAYLVHRVREDRNQLHAMNEQLQGALHRESELARTDPITGLANSRAFLEQLDRELARATRDERSITLLYLDLDGFKSVNDVYGHDTGNTVLRRVADALRESVRAGDSVARVGGDEFVALLWGTGAPAAEEVATRIAERVQAVAAGYAEATLGVSIGIAQAHGNSTAAAALIREADAAMYERKSARQTGR
ncbi:MAG TPA: GGDEF domain-containing protein [Thermoanaerobaculia bacterium]|nr:GGDEF domain-containing protein [Thermoanaerobaculia bacterium]